MKILIAITSESSVKTFYIDYLKYLNNQGLKVILASNFHESSTISLVEQTGTEISQIPFEREPNFKADLAALFAIYKSIKLTKPDIVIYATPKASLLTSIAACFALVPKRVYQLWGLRLEGQVGLTKFILWSAEKVTFSLSNVVISVSESLKEKAIQLHLGRQLNVIGRGSSHGVNLNRFSPLISPLPLPAVLQKLLNEKPDQHFVTLIARLSRDKGVDIFLDALELIKGNPDSPIGLLVGDIEDEFIADKISRFIEEGLVMHFPHVEDVRPFLQIATINCLPSIREGLPNVVLEASAMGVPSIVSNATGCVDSVIDGATGIILPANKPEILAKAITDTTKNTSLLTEMKINGLNFVQENYQDQIVYKNNYEFLVAV